MLSPIFRVIFPVMRKERDLNPEPEHYLTKERPIYLVKEKGFVRRNWLACFHSSPFGRAVELLPLNSKKKDEWDLTPCEPLPMFLGHWTMTWPYLLR